MNRCLARVTARGADGARCARPGASRGSGHAAGPGSSRAADPERPRAVSRACFPSGSAVADSPRPAIAIICARVAAGNRLSSARVVAPIGSSSRSRGRGGSKGQMGRRSIARSARLPDVDTPAGRGAGRCRRSGHGSACPLGVNALRWLGITAALSCPSDISTPGEAVIEILNDPSPIKSPTERSADVRARRRTMSMRRR
jgi:hypothetical protein